MVFIAECIKVFLLGVFGFDLISWRVGKAEKWALKHTKTITLKNGLKMLKAEKPFPFFYRIPLINPKTNFPHSADFSALFSIARKDPDVIIVCYFKHSSRVSLATTESRDRRSNFDRVKSDRIIENTQDKIFVDFRTPISEEELILAAEQSCDPNETLNPPDAEMQPADFDFVLFFKMVLFKIRIRWRKLKKLLFDTKKVSEEEEAAERKLIEENIRLFELREGESLLVGDPVFVFKYLTKFKKENNVKVVLERVPGELNAALWVQDHDPEFDLRKLESEYIITSTSNLAILYIKALSNMDVVEMLKKIIPEKTEGVGDAV